MALSVYLKEFFGRVQTVLADANGDQIDALAESDGTPKVVNYGKNSTTITAFGLETSGEQRTVMIGSNASGDFDRLRTDPNRILWTRPFEGWVQLDPVVIPSSEGILLDGSASLAASGVYDVAYRVVNIDGAVSVTVSVGVDIGAGGSLATSEYWMRSQIIPAGSNSGWEYGGIIGADDDIRGVAGAADDAAINFRVRRVDVGA
jgi:hypothetical protein